MNNVTVEFQGICTFVSRERCADLPVPQRVVLVNASQWTRIHETEIPPHIASVILPGRHAMVLEGVHLTLTVAGATQSNLPAFQRQLHSLPDLTALMEEHHEPLSPPSATMVLTPYAEHVACIFDISFGTLVAALDENHAAFTTLFAESEHGFVLEAQPLPGGTLPHDLAAVTPLPSGAVISVQNADRDSGERKTDVDFLLHYKVAELMPAHPLIPRMPPGPAATPPRRPWHPIGTIGAGCSNSNYP